MLRMACVALALALLSGCACLGPRQSAFGGGAVASFDAGQDVAPVENTAAFALLSLDRRRFSRPSERQPDLRMIFATAYDRKYRLAPRRWAKRIMRSRR